MDQQEDVMLSQTKLFVGGLDWSVRGKQLAEDFSQFGEVVFATVKLDKDTKKSRGFGFVEFKNPEDAMKAQTEMNGKEVRGRTINVAFARERAQQPEGTEE